MGVSVSHWLWDGMGQKVGMFIKKYVVPLSFDAIMNFKK